MSRVIKILYVFGGTMGFGGMESYMMNYYRHMDNSQCHIDFAVHGPDKGVYDDEIEEGGGRIFHVVRRNRHPFLNIKQLKQIMAAGSYDIVHCHMDAANVFGLYAAAKCGVPVRISHSHNTRHLTGNLFKKFFLDLCKRGILAYATDLYACSGLAGDWMYGAGSRYTVIPNAIKTGDFLFDRQRQKEMKRKFGLEKNVVLGHVGRFTYQKNHDFLIDVFKIIYLKNGSYRLILVGTGEEEDRVKARVRELGLKDGVIFLENRRDIRDLLNMFDGFVLPSRFEGLPIVLVEAQANGLCCVVSDAVTREACLVERLVHFLPSTQSAEFWAASIMEKIPRTRGEDRAVTEESFRETGYGIESAGMLLQQRYRKLLTGEGRI